MWRPPDTGTGSSEGPVTVIAGLVGRDCDDCDEPESERSLFLASGEINEGRPEFAFSTELLPSKVGFAVLSLEEEPDTLDIE
jgi:hypothetical protein